MMQVNDGNQYVLVCDRAVSGHLSYSGLALKCLYDDGKVVFIDADQLFDLAIETLRRVGIEVGPRYMDRFHFCSPVGQPEVRQKVLNDFFEVIAVDYESIIDVARNRENIRVLLGLISGEIGALNGLRIVDFGCGTGLAVDVAKDMDLSLVGVDTCSKMRQRAAGRGMNVLSQSDLELQPSCFADAAFASYVFHLLPNPDLVRLLWNRIRCSGVLAINFHKEVGREMTEALLLGMGALLKQVVVPAEAKIHGHYSLFIKQN